MSLKSDQLEVSGSVYMYSFRMYNTIIFMCLDKPAGKSLTVLNAHSPSTDKGIYLESVVGKLTNVLKCFVSY